MDDYIRAATVDGRTPQNAILAQTVKLEEASELVQSRSTYVTLGSVIAAALFALAVVGAISGAWQIHSNAQQFVSSASEGLRSSIAELTGQVETLRERSAVNGEDASALKDRVSSLEAQLNALSDSGRAARNQSSGSEAGAPPSSP